MKSILQSIREEIIEAEQIRQQFLYACSVVQECVQKHQLEPVGGNIFDILVRDYERLKEKYEANRST